MKNKPPIKKPEEKVERKRVKVELKEDIGFDEDAEEQEEMELEEIVQSTPAPRSPKTNERISPVLEMQENTQDLEAGLQNVPIGTPGTDQNRPATDNTSNYATASSAYQSAMNYELNVRNYDEEAGYPKQMPLQPENPFRLTSPWSGQSTMSPILRQSDQLASNEYPEQMKNIRNYNSPKEEKRRRE